MSDNQWLRERPIAHRGLYNNATGQHENSLPAFEEACRQRYPVELDVQLTVDGGVAVIHDRLRRGATTEDLRDSAPLLDEHERNFPY
jgi:glycerophosphoryl diester phosphodiesterase